MFFCPLASQPITQLCPHLLHFPLLSFTFFPLLTSSSLLLVPVRHDICSKLPFVWILKYIIYNKKLTLIDQLCKRFIRIQYCNRMTRCLISHKECRKVTIFQIKEGHLIEFIIKLSRIIWFCFNIFSVNISKGTHPQFFLMHFILLFINGHIVILTLFIKCLLKRYL